MANSLTSNSTHATQRILSFGVLLHVIALRDKQTKAACIKRKKMVGGDDIAGEQ